MTDELKIKILNTESELLSFPIDQSITLTFTEEVEDSYLEKSIHLIQSLDSGSIFHIGDTYNQNVGLIKEEYKIVEKSITITNRDPFTIQIKPSKPLTPGHTYQLLVQDSLPKEFVEVVKNFSMSSSEIVLKGTNASLKDSFDIVVTADSEISKTKHVVKLLVNNKAVTLDLKRQSTYTLGGAILSFTGDVFVEGESFTVFVNNSQETLNTSFLVKIKAASTKNIRPIESSSPLLSYEDLLKFNNPETPPVVDYSYTVFYKNKKVFRVIFKEGVVSELDLEGLTSSFEEAFNMYTLESMELFNEALSYKLTNRVISDNEIEFKVEVSDEDIL